MPKSLRCHPALGRPNRVFGGGRHFKKEGLTPTEAS